MSRELAELGALQSAEVVARTARHFSWGFRLLPIRRRRAIETLYAFARHADDLADEPGPTLQERREGSRTRRWLDARCSGIEPVTPGGSTRETVEQYHLGRPPRPHRRHGVDAQGQVYNPDTEDYCRRAASTIGLLSTPIFSATDRAAAREPAIRLGLFMQLVSICAMCAKTRTGPRVFSARSAGAPRHAGQSVGSLTDAPFPNSRPTARGS